MTTIGKVTSDFLRSIWILAAFSLLTNLLVLAQPLYMLQVYDRVLPSQSTDTLLFLTLVVAFSLLILGLLEIVRSVIANRAAARFDVGLSDLALRIVIANSFSGGSNAQPLRDIASLRSLIASKALFGVLDLPFATIFIAIMYFIHPSLFWLTLGGASILTMVVIFNQWALGPATRDQGDLAVAASQRAEYLARTADSLIAMGMVSNVVNRWGEVHARALAAADKAARLNAWFAGFSRVLRIGLQIAILGYGALLVLEGELTAGMIFAASLISGRALQPIDQIIGSWRQLAAGREAWKRVQAFMGKADLRDEYTSLPAPNGLLVATDIVQFNPSDPTKPPILAGISFSLKPGESVAVLGPSGSGKSTLARILVGAATPRAGHVRIDGHDISNWNPEDLGRHIGYLSQDVELVPGTIAQNISRFDPNPSDEAIVAAAHAAHVVDVIQRMPRGYDTSIGPGGVQVSGGEKQLIGLARALYGSPRILVLDEPDASLDRSGELALMRALSDAHKRGVTVFIITQRERVLAGVDKIMRMQSGKLLDYDTRDKVFERFRDAGSRAGDQGSGPSKPLEGQATDGKSVPQT